MWKVKIFYPFQASQISSEERNSDRKIVQQALECEEGDNLVSPDCFQEDARNNNPKHID